MLYIDILLKLKKYDRAYVIKKDNMDIFEDYDSCHCYDDDCENYSQELIDEDMRRMDELNIKEMEKKYSYNITNREIKKYNFEFKKISNMIIKNSKNISLKLSPESFQLNNNYFIYFNSNDVVELVHISDFSYNFKTIKKITLPKNNKTLAINNDNIAVFGQLDFSVKVIDLFNKKSLTIKNLCYELVRNLFINSKYIVVLLDDDILVYNLEGTFLHKLREYYFETKNCYFIYESTIIILNGVFMEEFSLETGKHIRSFAYEPHIEDEYVEENKVIFNDKFILVAHDNVCVMDYDTGVLLNYIPAKNSREEITCIHLYENYLFIAVMNYVSSIYIYDLLDSKLLLSANATHKQIVSIKFNDYKDYGILNILLDDGDFIKMNISKLESLKVTYFRCDNCFKLFDHKLLQCSNCSSVFYCFFFF
jgi:hypothetical protein